MEFAIVKHQGKSLKMMGELASTWIPKTRPRNKLRLNMKKLLNPRINTKEITVLDDDSSDEKPKIDKGKSKGKKEAVIKISVSHHTKGKRPLNTVEESSLTETKISAVFLELRGEMLKEQQGNETEVSYSEDKLLIDEIVPTETINQENPSVHGVSSDLLQEDEDIFRRMNIPWLPSELQNTTAGKAFDSEKENLQRTIKQYKHQMEYM